MTSGTVTITALSSVQIKIRKKEGNQHLDTLAYRNVSEALDWQVNFLLLRYLALCYFSIERRTAGGFRFLSLVQGLQMRPRSNFFVSYRRRNMSSSARAAGVRGYVVAVPGFLVTFHLTGPRPLVGQSLCAHFAVDRIESDGGETFFTEETNCQHTRKENERDGDGQTTTFQTVQQVPHPPLHLLCEEYTV